MSERIAIIGGGNMGYALAIGLVASSNGAIVSVSDPDVNQLTKFDGSTVLTNTDNAVTVRNADVVVFSVKPQVLAAVVKPLVSLLDEKLVISIAAGVPLSALESWLGQRSAIIRCMPNTPALLGEGITGLIANDLVTEVHKTQAECILSSVGQTIWFGNDNDLDIVTALSGSGPAYWFYMLEAMIEAGRGLGLRLEDAHQLAVQTAVGASKMAATLPDSPQQLRLNVTSPGGTTERGVDQMETAAVYSSIQNAVNAAYQRSKEIAEEFSSRD